MTWLVFIGLNFFFFFAISPSFLECSFNFLLRQLLCFVFSSSLVLLRSRWTRRRRLCFVFSSAKNARFFSQGRAIGVAAAVSASGKILLYASNFLRSSGSNVASKSWITGLLALPAAAFMIQDQEVLAAEVIVSVGSAPWDQLFGGGNSPALAVGAAAGFIGGIVAILALPRTRIPKPIPLQSFLVVA